jgi:predicted RNA binding protein YcfA (HicA-like mRNA interferase family)
MLSTLPLSAVCISVYRMAMGSREIIKRLMKDGWEEVAQKGSHKQFRHPSKPGRVTVKHPIRDMPKGTLASIEKQAGIKLR